jgi:hypothetical protein
MNAHLHRLAAVTGVAFVLAAPPLAAADRVATDRYGSPADGMPFDRELRLWPNAKIGVWRTETIRFVTDEGRQFSWRFDGRAFQVFPLDRIAPADLAVPANVSVYVTSEIPIAP